MNKTLLVKKQGKTIPALTQAIPPEGIISVGSDPSATIEIESETSAPEQFVIVCEGGQSTLLCRADGTEINGNLLPKGSLHNLDLHDRIVVGDYSITVEAAGETANLVGKASTAGEDAAAERPDTAAPEAVRDGKEPVAENVRQEPAEDQAFSAEKSLSDVLEGLKAEEKFYFLIENGGPEKRRIYVESEEMWLGWTSTGECVISEDPTDIAIPRAQIRKDWSGVVLYPLKDKNIWLNNTAIEEPHRLKNDDLLQMQSREKALPDATTSIKFHEPTALLVLDSILPKELPPPVSLDKKSSLPDADSEGRKQVETGKSAAVTGRAAEQISNGRIFGYFTGLEILIMAIGIIVAAVLIFFVLEYY